MNRMRAPMIVLAVLLAALLPLEQAHCAWMPLQARAAAAPGAMKADHSCCRPAPAAASHCGSTAKCPCIQLPAAALPAAAPATAPAPVSLHAVLATASLLAAPAAAPAPVPAPDVGSPPLPILDDAHGLRAPPLS